MYMYVFFWLSWHGKSNMNENDFIFMKTKQYSGSVYLGDKNLGKGCDLMLIFALHICFLVFSDVQI